jgi:D-glycero-D-manno-heptose 1,7-bisphosphate phosphatase
VAGGLIILDRDGVINQDSEEFIKTPEEWIPLPGSLQAIALLSAAGFEVAVASNQSGVGRKLIDGPALLAIHQKMLRLVRDAGGDIGRIVFCPHHPDDACNCRKPAPGLLQDLSRHYGVPLGGVPIVGDSLRDVEAAVAVGGRPILVLTGNGAVATRELFEQGRSVESFPCLLDAAKALIEEKRRH